MTPLPLLHRHIESRVLENLKVFPAVFINGPRQSGKTTLVRDILAEKVKTHFITFDDLRQRASAMMNPHNFIEAAGTPLIIDEVQMVPDVFSALKMCIDKQRYENLSRGEEKPNGRYLLTGSANLNLVPKLAYAMVGRMGTLTLLPLSVRETTQQNPQDDFIARAFAKDFSHLTPVDRTLLDAMSVATYPELVAMNEPERQEWFQGYVRKIALEDPSQLYNLEKAEAMPVLLQILANRAGSLINNATLGQEIGLNTKTAHLYRTLLEGTFITLNLRPWYRNIEKRLVKAGKIYFYDTLLLCHLLQSTPQDLQQNNPLRFGHVLENFVLTELLKQINNGSNPRMQVRFYRTHDGREVDFVLEDPAGKLVGIEVKHAERISPSDLAGLKELQAVSGKDFVCGIVLCNTPTILPYGENIFLVPLNALWG